MTDLPARTEVAIIGGGFAGCATAWALADCGIRAIVIEREPTLGCYASGRAAGLGRQLADDDATTALTVRGAAILRTRFSEAWDAVGGILTFDDSTARGVYLARAARFGISAEIVSRAAVLERWPAFDELPASGGLWVPSDGVIDVRGLLARLAERCQIVRDTRVVELAACAGGARLITSRGPLDATVVVDAAGAWAGIASGAAPLEAYKRHLFVIEAVAAQRAPFLWHLGRRELYVRRDRDGVMISTCDQVAEPAGDAVPDPAASHALRDLLASTAPGWGASPITRAWACQRSFTPDRQMRLGRDPERPWLVWAAGLGGHGATASAAVGEVVAESVIAALSSGS